MPSTTITKPARDDIKNITEVKMRWCVEKKMLKIRSCLEPPAPGPRALLVSKPLMWIQEKGGGNDGPALHVVKFARRGVLAVCRTPRRLRKEKIPEEDCGRKKWKKIGGEEKFGR